VALTDKDREYWTSLFVDEFDAEYAGNDDHKANRRVLLAHGEDQDRDNRAEVGRLRQEVRARFYTDKGYIQRPDSRGIMRFVDPATVTPRGRRRIPRIDGDAGTWPWRFILGIAGLLTTILVFALVIGC
jgi:hypothetical protein